LEKGVIMKKGKTIVGEKISVEGTEYLRVDGIWFRQCNGEYITEDQPTFEAFYKEYLKHD
jgi:hypothetical protein